MRRPRALPSSPVWAIALGAAAVACGPPESEAQDTGSPLAAAVARLVENVQGRGGAPGISVGVMRGDSVLLARGYGYADVENEVPATARSVYRIGSMGKQFTAHLVLQLVADGQLALDDPVSRYLPELGAPASLTIRRLLNHTSGLASYPDTVLYRSQAMRLDTPVDSVVGWIAARPPESAPGSTFRYNNGGYYLLGVITERVTGKPYEALLRERIFEPLGMASSAYCDEHRLIPGRAQGYGLRDGEVVRAEYLSMSHVYAAGAICSSVLDLLRWQRALHGYELLGAAAYRQMTTPVPPAGPPERQYGFGLIMAEIRGRRIIAHGGGINGFQSFALYVPDLDLSVVVLSNQEQSGESAPAAIALAVLALATEGAARP